MLDLLVAKVFFNLLVFHVSNPLSLVPHWNQKVNYMYAIFGFTNKYLHGDGVVVIFHDDDPLVFKEISQLVFLFIGFVFFLIAYNNDQDTLFQ